MLSHPQSEDGPTTMPRERTQCIIASVPGWNPGPGWNGAAPFRCHGCGEWVATTRRRCYFCGRWPCLHHGRCCRWNPWRQHGSNWQHFHGWRQESFLDAQESCHSPTPTSPCVQSPSEEESLPTPEDETGVAFIAGPEVSDASLLACTDVNSDMRLFDERNSGVLDTGCSRSLIGHK